MAFKPISRATGPLTTIIAVAGLVVACMPCKLNLRSVKASTAAINVRMVSGLHPAITALMAIPSTVATPKPGCTVAMTASALRPLAAIMHCTRSSVGGRSGMPSPQRRSMQKRSKSSGSSGTSMRPARVGAADDLPGATPAFGSSAIRAMSETHCSAIPRTSSRVRRPNGCGITAIGWPSQPSAVNCLRPSTMN